MVEISSLSLVNGMAVAIFSIICKIQPFYFVDIKGVFIVVDWIIIGLFIISFPLSWYAARWRKPWTSAIAIITTVLLGFRALYQFEFGSKGMAWAQAGLFLLGLLLIWGGMQMSKKEPSKGA